jgi:hypothetical protein
MIQPFVDHFMASKEQVLEDFRSKRPQGYEDLVARLVTLLGNQELDEWGMPDPQRITKIDHGDYQGMLLFVIGAKGYQPSTYWYIPVSYGSCSGCDTFEAIAPSWADELLSDEALNGLWTLMLHMVQKMKQINGYEEAV